MINIFLFLVLKYLIQNLTNRFWSVEELTAGKLKEEENRLSGLFVWSLCEGPLAYLSSFSNQLTISEANQDDREFLN